MLKTLRDNFQLAMVLLLCSCAIVAIAPFVVMRAMAGEWVMAAADAAIVSVMGAILFGAWKTQNARWASVLLTVSYTLGAIGMIYLKPQAMIYWLYPAVVGNFFVLRIRHAASLNTAAIIAITPQAAHFEQTLELVDIIVTLVLLNAFSAIFSWKTEDQRRLLHEQATLDPLTGIGNRRKLYQQLDNSQGQHFIGAMVMLDIDHFKQINDEFGHEEGDQVLQNVARLLHGRLRANNDQVFRYGGEEFLLLLHQTDLDGAIRVAESLRRQLADSEPVPGRRLTASFGCAVHRPGEAWEEWIARADEALYQAKNAGRNCVRAGED